MEHANDRNDAGGVLYLCHTDELNVIKNLGY